MRRENKKFSPSLHPFKVVMLNGDMEVEIEVC